MAPIRAKRFDSLAPSSSRAGTSSNCRLGRAASGTLYDLSPGDYRVAALVFRRGGVSFGYAENVVTVAAGHIDDEIEFCKYKRIVDDRL